ncbi:MAG: multidrug transporter AcrB [Candidatus Hydrogenedentota bacterium]
MIDALIRWSVKNRAAVVVISLIVTALGLYTARQMPIDVFPDLTAPTVTVVADAVGMAPTEVESLVTFPIEAALNGASSVRRVRSATAVGIAVIWVEFDWGTSIYEARQIVNEKLALVDLPPEASRPILAPISSIMGEIMFIALTSDRHSKTELRTLAETTIRRRLLSVAGVSQVTATGGDEKQYQVVLSPSRLAAYNVSVQQVTDALTASNENVSAGFLIEGGSEFLVKGEGRAHDLQDIGATVVLASDGVPVHVSDLGTVQMGAAPKRGDGAANGQPAVVIGIQKQPLVNTLALTKELDVALDDIQSELPEGMLIQKDLFRQARFIETAIENVLHALRDGGILVVVIVVLFLANVRASFITLAAIPLSLLTAVLALKALGATINTMTLGGMAIAIGALVDDAIIDVENVARRLRENARLPESDRKSALDVVYRGSVEIRSSIVFATLIIMLVFLPVFFLSGVEGRLLAPLGTAYVVSLFASLVIAVTLTPALCHLLLPQSRSIRQAHEPRLIRALQRFYGPVLDRALRHPWAVTAPAVALLGMALFGMTRMGGAFLPDFNEGSLTISAVTLPGTSLDESLKLAEAVDSVLLAQPEVVTVARRTGRAERDEHVMGVESSEIEVSLSMRERSKGELLEKLREEFSQIPGMNITIGQPISHRIDHMLSGTRANLAVKIFGKDLFVLRSIAESIRAGMSSIEGVVDLSVEQQMDVPVVLVRFDRAALATHRLHIRDAARTVEAALQGIPVTRILEGPYAYDLRVRLDEGDGWSMDTLGDVPLDAGGGAKIPLKQVAAITRTTGPNMISREQVQRKIVVQCNVAGRDVASVVDDIRTVAAPILAQNPGYTVEYGGQFQSAEEAGRWLTVLGILVTIGIGFLLHLAFGSGRDAAFVMINLPLALIGGVAGVYVSGGVLSVASMIGFITVFGIAARNGIMLISHIRHLQDKEGVTEFHEAVYRGSMERVAPILMTALAAGLALIPLALGGERPGNEIQTPMAIVILFGLLTSMALNMVITPALYLRFGRPVSARKESDL